LITPIINVRFPKSIVLIIRKHPISFYVDFFLAVFFSYGLQFSVFCASYLTASLLLISNNKSKNYDFSFLSFESAFFESSFFKSALFNSASLEDEDLDELEELEDFEDVEELEDEELEDDDLIEE